MGIAQGDRDPPWAETVWERVRKTLESSAQLLPDWAICSAARMPAPPAPITTASNSRVGIVTLHTPQHDETRHQIDEQHHHQRKLQRTAQPDRLDIVGQHLPQTDPGVDQTHRSVSRVKTLVKVVAKKPVHTS